MGTIIIGTVTGLLILALIVHTIARFARNTVDCLKYVRLLNDLGVDVYFEEQGIHSNQPGAEFYITIYGSIAQSESENISANIKWGKAQAAREGKVVFRYKNFLGYRKGDDGQPEIVPQEAETIRLIYDRFLAGDSLKGIAELLEEKGIKSPTGKAEWQFSTIQSILSNEKYKGDAIINKTYITDCISKKVKVNNGERPKYEVVGLADCIQPLGVDDYAVLFPGFTLRQQLTVKLGKDIPHDQGGILGHHTRLLPDCFQPQTGIDICTGF